MQLHSPLTGPHSESGTSSKRTARRGIGKATTQDVDIVPGTEPEKGRDPQRDRAQSAQLSLLQLSLFQLSSLQRDGLDAVVAHRRDRDVSEHV